MKKFELSPLFCLTNNVVILEDTEDFLIIGISEIDNEELKSKITKSFVLFEGNCPRELIYKEISKEQCKKMISEILAESKTEKIQLQNVEIENISESPAVNFLEALFIECLEDFTISDIHFEPYDDKYRIRLRKNGDLIFHKTLERNLFSAISRRIKVLCNLNGGDTRQIQEGSFSYKNLSLEADIRASFIPLFLGESLVLRLLRGNCIPPKIEDLGFSREQVDILKNNLQKKSSLILICGATGAGKTTTLAALLNLIKDSNQKIISIEDPVEYSLLGVSQIQISKELELDYHKVLKSTFRHDPDVIMIGEIRDEETAKIAVRGALTGHLVLGTLHTKDCGSVIPRLLDLGVKPFLLASVFGLALAQKLIKQDCGGRKAVGEILETSMQVKKMIAKESSSLDFDNYLRENKIQRIWESENE